MTRRGYKIPPSRMPPSLQLFLLGGAALWLGWNTAEFTWSVGSFIVARLIDLIGRF